MERLSPNNQRIETSSTVPLKAEFKINREAGQFTIILSEGAPLSHLVYKISAQGVPYTLVIGSVELSHAGKAEIVLSAGELNRANGNILRFHFQDAKDLVPDKPETLK